MISQKNNYNLLEEKWIPVMWTGGRYSRIGITGALTQAHRIRQIGAGGPRQSRNHERKSGT